MFNELRRKSGKEGGLMDGKIVYGQKDLESALSAGEKRITLCAGIYRIPVCEGVTFSRLGPVKADVLCSREAAETEGMVFDGIEPVFHARYAIDTEDPMRVVSAGELLPGGSGSYGSGSYLGGSGYAGSYGSGFFTSGSFGSGSGGHYYEYEFEFELGRGSFSNSFAMLYTYSGSYGESYRYGSGSALCAILPLKTELPERFIRVFGYGINLI